MLNNKYINKEFTSYEDFKNNLEINIPENFNFAFDVVDEIANKEPQKKAMVWCDEKGTHRDFTFGEIKKYSNKTANFFKSLGIKKGDAVMLILKRRFEFWFSIIALHKIGAVPIPATHLLTEKDIVYRNNVADIKMIVAVATDNVPQAVNKAESKSSTLKFKVAVNGNVDGWYNFEQEIEKQSEIFERPAGPDATKNDDKFLLYFTSGTTGMPKMVLHDFTYPLGHIITATWQNIHEGGLHLTVADTGWAKSAWGKLYGQWINGCTVFVYDYDKFTPKELLTVISKYGVTSFCAPPTIYRYFIKEDVTKYDLSNLKYCTIAGEPLNPEVYNQWKDLTGLRLMEAFGQTETVSLLCNFPWMEPKVGSMGKPSPLYNIDIVDENYNSCEPGEVGQIAIRVEDKKPIGMFCGYYRDEALTKKVWHDGLYFTGDTAYKDEDGHYWFVGRADDIIKSSGYRIGPFEVESALIEHPSVLECAITAVPDPDRGQIVKATIVLAKGYFASEELKKEIQNHVKKVTAPYKYPRIVEFVTELPKTISGKIRRVQIREEGDK
ncbi:MAG: AMP-binding protein [Endomicrobiaceae bacterium]|nr:AMP-binding protein [Endomicrobiaceae bacterium]